MKIQKTNGRGQRVGRGSAEAAQGAQRERAALGVRLSALGRLRRRQRRRRRRPVRVQAVAQEDHRAAHVHETAPPVVVHQRAGPRPLRVRLSPPPARAARHVARRQEQERHHVIRF